MLQFNKLVAQPDSPPSRLVKQQGVTLVELIIAIVIISVAAVALLQGLGFQTSRNVDPMIQSQSQALARQYLDEVMSRSFFDPANDPRLNPGVSQALAASAESDSTARTLDATNRQLFDNIFEYNGYNQTPQSLDGTPIVELAGYQIAITVDSSIGLTLGTISNSADASSNACPAEVMLITVTVTDPRNQVTSLQGYRTSYFDSGQYAGC